MNSKKLEEILQQNNIAFAYDMGVIKIIISQTKYHKYWFEINKELCWYQNQKNSLEIEVYLRYMYKNLKQEENLVTKFILKLGSVNSQQEFTEKNLCDFIIDCKTDLRSIYKAAVEWDIVCNLALLTLNDIKEIWNDFRINPILQTTNNYIEIRNIAKQLI